MTMQEKFAAWAHGKLIRWNCRFSKNEELVEFKGWANDDDLFYDQHGAKRQAFGHGFPVNDNGAWVEVNIIPAEKADHSHIDTTNW